MSSRNRYSREPCKHPGCAAYGGPISGYCKDHIHGALKCMVDGCENRVAAHSRSRCCKDHRREGVRLLRKAFKPWGQ